MAHIDVAMANNQTFLLRILRVCSLNYVATTNLLVLPSPGRKEDVDKAVPAVDL